MGGVDTTLARHILGVSSDRPSPDELRGAWRRFARENHPDRRPGDPEAARRFAVGHDAYETLGACPAARPARPGRRPDPAPAPPPPARPPEPPRPAGPPLRHVLRGPLMGAVQPYTFPAVDGREWRA